MSDGCHSRRRPRGGLVRSCSTTYHSTCAIERTGPDGSNIKDNGRDAPPFKWDFRWTLLLNITIYRLHGSAPPRDVAFILVLEGLQGVAGSRRECERNGPATASTTAIFCVEGSNQRIHPTRITTFFLEKLPFFRWFAAADTLFQVPYKRKRPTSFRW